MNSTFLSDLQGNWTQDIKYLGNIRKPYRDETAVLSKATSLKGQS